MSTRNTGAAVSGTMLSPAELAVPVDEDLVALIPRAARTAGLSM